MAGDVERALDAVRELYTGNLAEHGVTPAAVGWPDPDAQRLRFEQLCHALAGTDAGDVADLGCGYGALFEHLLATGRDVRSYRGYDLSAAMLAAARARIADPRATWVHGGTLDADADHVFVSGTFNVRFDADRAAWAAWVRETLRALWARTRSALAFNVLTTYVDWRADHLHYEDPRELLDFCHRELSPRVAILHDTPLWEFTVIVRRAR